jgi:hypothetical protein
MDKIILPYAEHTVIPIMELIQYFQDNKLNYIIIGSTKVTLQNHPKPNSLDVWLRTLPNVIRYKDTCQSVNNVVSQLIKHESFSLGLRKCPKSNRMCKALVFCDNK